MTLRTLAMLGGLALLVPVTATAQDHKGGCACCAQSGHGSHGTAAKPPADSAQAPLADANSPAPLYEVQYEGLVAGVIQSVMRHPGMDVELTIGVGEKTFDVLVAPVEWLDQNQAAFRPGERAEIIGARTDRGSGETIVAREIHTSGQTLVVRDSEGRPLWD